MILPLTVSAQAQDPCAGGGLQPSGPINCELRSPGHFTLFIGEGTINSSGNSSPGVRLYGFYDGLVNFTLVSSEVDINTNRDRSEGIFVGYWRGYGDINITTTGGSITTLGTLSSGIRGDLTRLGNLGITVTGGSITINSSQGHGIHGNKRRYGDSPDRGDGNLVISVTDASITTKSDQSRAIYGHNGFEGDIAITVSDGKIRTEGLTGGLAADGELFNSFGIYALHEGEGDIGINVSGGSITTVGEGAHGIYAHHGVSNNGIEVKGGSGDIGINVSGGSITTAGEGAHGIYALNVVISYANNMRREVKGGTGNLGITVSDGSITTAGDDAHGIYARHKGTGDNSITVSGGSITTAGERASGIYALHETNASEGNIVISVLEEATITTEGATAHGIHGFHEGTDNISISVSGGSITTESSVSYGIYGQHSGAGNVSVSVSGGSITTKELNSYGIYAVFEIPTNTGHVDITVSDGSITTEGMGAHGIFVHHLGLQATQEDTEDAASEKIAVDLSGGSISTTGENASGISVVHEHPGEGKISIITRDGHTITTEGANAHGLVVYNNGIEPSAVVVENIMANGVGAYGIQFGRLNDDGKIEGVPAASVDDDGTRQLLNDAGYRPLSVRINGTVMGGQASEEDDGAHGAGVFMAGGGRVEIGPEGVLGAQSDIAIHAVGDNKDTGEESQRKLYVNIESTDGKPWERLSGRIVNKGGETILAVNGTNVFDNGHIDVWLQAGSLRQFKLNPDEDFSTLDFSEEEDWLYRYQAIAGAYEALPGALRRIDTTACHVPTQQNYIGVCGGRGQYTPDQTTTGMSYAYNQQALHGHIMRPLSEQVSGWVGLRQVSGEANVNIAAGSSRVTVRGVGVHGGVQVMGDTDLYGQAHLQWTRYTLNLVSGTVRGTTKGTAWSLGLEGGRHFRVDDETRVTGRGWLKHANVSVTPFEDSVGLRVSGQERRVIAGVGVRGERTMVQANEDRRVVLRGSAGIETAVSEASTVMVGDEVLSSQAKATRLLLDVGGVLHQGDTEFHGMVYAHGLGADDTAYGLRLGLEWSF